MSVSAKSKSISKTKRSKAIGKPFDEKIRQQAAKAVADYKIMIKRGGEFGYVGSCLEVPTIHVEGSTVKKCYAAAEESLRVIVSVMLENGKTPPAAFSPKKRTAQVNIRLNNEEKLLFISASKRLGFKGLADCIRTCALEKIQAAG